jgi:hypothetical protein
MMIGTKMKLKTLFFLSSHFTYYWSLTACPNVEETKNLLVVQPRSILTIMASSSSSWLHEQAAHASVLGGGRCSWNKAIAALLLLLCSSWWFSWVLK